MEACYNKLCSCPICKSYWYVSYSTLLFVQWVPLNRHLPYADTWSKLPLDLLFCTHRNHDFSRVFRLSGPLVHPALQISCYEVTECFYTSLDEMLLRRRVPPPPSTNNIHYIYKYTNHLYTRVERDCESKTEVLRKSITQWTWLRTGNQTQNVWGTRRRPLFVWSLVPFLFNPQDPLVVTFKIYYLMGNESIDWQAPVRLGCPLVSSVFVQWDWWITCGKLPGVKCTQV